jgi:hypothetical protein
MGGCWSNSDYGSVKSSSHSNKYNGSSHHLSGIQNVTAGSSGRPAASGGTSTSNSNRRPNGRLAMSVIDFAGDTGAELEPQNRPAIVFPDDPVFHCSINGRNKWRVEDVYDLGKSVRHKIWFTYMDWIYIWIHIIYIYI